MFDIDGTILPIEEVIGLLRICLRIASICRLIPEGTPGISKLS